MNSFTNFYLTEESKSIQINIITDGHKWSEVNKDLYDYSKRYLKNLITLPNGFKVNDRIFKVQSYEVGDPNKSQINDKGLFGHDWESIKEIIKYNLNFGVVYLMTVSQGVNDYYFVSNDRKFTDAARTNIHHILDALRPKQKSKTQEKQFKAQSAEQQLKNKQIEVSKKADQEKQTAIQNKELSKKIASELGLKEISTFQFKNEMLDITFEAKSKEEAENKIKEATNKLPDTDPRHGRYGYFDLSFDDFDMLTGPKGRFYSNRNWKSRSELQWQTNTRTSEDKEFGIGLMYPLKVTAPKKIEGLVYIFKYNEKYLPNSAILVFDGINSLEVFNTLGILKTTDVIGLDKKIRISKASHLRWVDEDPRNIAPPLTAKTVSQIDQIINKTEVSTKTKYITPKKKESK